MDTLIQIAKGAATVLVGVGAGAVLGYVEGRRAFRKQVVARMEQRERQMATLGGYQFAIELAGFQAARRWFVVTFGVRV